jgi:phosphatidylglycerol:prolipoprotein diacylglycerol transferase
MFSSFGLFMLLAFTGAYFAFRSEYRRKEAEGLIRPPYPHMDILLFWCGLSGFAGAVIFAKFEKPTLYYLFRFNGLNYYGALIAGTLTYLYINKRYGIRPAIAADIGSPGMMLAYAIGRIGCHVAGDGDWGIVNEKPRPGWLSWLPDWAWAYRYPHTSAPVYPTSVYEAAICCLLFLGLWWLRRTLKKPGLLFAFFAILNGAERFLIEFIRVNPRISFGGWNLSQAQFLAAGWVLTGLLTLVFLAKKLIAYI